MTTHSSHATEAGMRDRERHSTLLRTVRERGYLPLSAAITITGVSASTVRRDLDRLARRRLLERVPGGALALDARAV